MSEEQREQTPLPSSLGIGFGTLATAEIVASIAHLGPTGLVVGGILGFVAYRHGSGIVEQVKSVFPAQPALPQRQTQRRVLYGTCSFADRVRGYYPDETVEASREEPKQPTTYQDAPTESTPDVSLPVFSRYPQDETLALGTVARTGQRFDPHIDDLNGQGLIVAGTQGMGKSNIAALVVENAARCGMPCIVFDVKQEYHTLLDVVPRGIRAGHASLATQTRGRAFVLGIENAPDFVAYVMGNGLQAVIDLPSYEHMQQSAQVIAAVLRSLMAWSKAQAVSERVPCLVLLDEAHLFLPQRAELSPLVGKDTQNALSSAFFEIVNMGRSYGYTMCFFTQSLANIQKWAIKNCKRKIIGSCVEKNDLNACEDEVDARIASREDFFTMPAGHAVVMGFTREPMIVHFDRRQSQHPSHTPTVKRAHERYTHAQGSYSLPCREPQCVREPVVPIRPYIVPALPKEEPVRTSKPAEASAQSTGHFTSALSPELATALRLYVPGMTYRELAAKMKEQGIDIGKDTAGKLIVQLKARRLIA